MKKLFLVLGALTLSLTIHSVLAQDRFDELKDYCTTHETILKRINEAGTYGAIEIVMQNELVYVNVANIYSLPDPGNTNTLYALDHKEIKLVQAGKTITPHIYIGQIDADNQVCVIHTFQTGDIYGNNNLVLVDGKNKNSYIIDLPGIIQKVYTFESGILVEQSVGGYHNPMYEKIYSLINIDNNTVVTTNYQRQLFKD